MNWLKLYRLCIGVLDCVLVYGIVYWYTGILECVLVNRVNIDVCSFGKSK